jgi:hypothetical protein
MKRLLIGMVCMCNLLLAGCVAYDPGYDHGDYARRGYDRDRDRDRDGIPDARDRDRDGDGVPNRADRRPDNPRRY